MPPIRSIIVDDEDRARSYLNDLLVEYCPEVQIVGAAHSATSAHLLINDVQPDLVFLDIQLSDHTGFDLLKMFDAPDFDVIFTTAFSHYSLQAIKVSAIDYLIKPIDPEELQAAVIKTTRKKKPHADSIAHLLATLGTSKNKKIVVPDYRGISYLELREIVRFQGDGNYCKIFLDDGNMVLSTRRIKEYEASLDESVFFRIHQSHMINMSKVRRYIHGKGGSVIMSDGSEVEVSRRKKSEFLQRLEDL